jgi:Uma2 family endonuclease
MATDITQPGLEIPPLRHGDRLTRAEFERRCEAMPELEHAELINGVVHMTPVSRSHGQQHFNLSSILGYYQMQTPGTEGALSTSIRFDDENMPQPDSLLRILETHGGRSRVDEDEYYTIGPELVMEVARSSSPYDLGEKRVMYQRFGVPEYIVWRVEDQAVDHYLLRGGAYERIPLGSDGIYRSEQFPGLRIDMPALYAKDWSRILAVAQLGIGSPEHLAFVAELRRRAGQ